MLIAALLIAEAMWTVPRLAAVVYTIAAYDPVAIVLIGARACVTAAQLTAAMLLVQRRPPARPIARIALAAAAVLLTLEAGFNLAPSAVYPFWRWQIVTVYWLYAAGAVWWLTRADRDGDRAGPNGPACT